MDFAAFFIIKRRWVCVHRTDAADPSHPKIVHAFMPRDTEGYRIESTWDVLGMRNQPVDDLLLVRAEAERFAHALLLEEQVRDNLAAAIGHAAGPLEHIVECHQRVPELAERERPLRRPPPVQDRRRPLFRARK
jgi:alkylation response protein AidB-like acyl-CoA dehydrogenase